MSLLGAVRAQLVQIPLVYAMYINARVLVHLALPQREWGANKAGCRLLWDRAILDVLWWAVLLLEWYLVLRLLLLFVLSLIPGCVCSSLSLCVSVSDCGRPLPGQPA